MAKAKKKEDKVKKTTHTGRRSKLNETTLVEILKYIKRGVSFADSCTYMGIGESTFYVWIQKGEKAIKNKTENIYREFVEGIRQAEVAAKIRRVSIIAKHENKDPRLALEMLARKYPEEFGRKDAIRQSIDLNVQVKSPQDQLLQAEKRAEELGYEPDNDKKKKPRSNRKRKSRIKAEPKAS